MLSSLYIIVIRFWFTSMNLKWRNSFSFFNNNYKRLAWKGGKKCPFRDSWHCWETHDPHELLEDFFLMMWGCVLGCWADILGTKTFLFLTTCFHSYREVDGSWETSIRSVFCFVFFKLQSVLSASKKTAPCSQRFVHKYWQVSLLLLPVTQGHLHSPASSNTRSPTWCCYQ